MSRYVISSSVPRCPSCSGALRLVDKDYDRLYACTDEGKSYIVVDHGQAENEVIIEEVKGE